MDKAMNWTRDLERDILEWDTVNWRRAVHFWDAGSICDRASLRVLDVGARGGGLSLLFGQRGIADYTKYSLLGSVRSEGKRRSAA